MGCVTGGYHSILENIRNKLQQNGVSILPGHDVQKLNRVSSNRWRLDISQGKSMVFDKVITTLSNPGIIELLPHQNTEALRNQLKKIKYLNLVCITLLLKSGLCPYYVTNLTDPGFPFTGVIDATNIVPEKILKGRGLIYLPRWMPTKILFAKNRTMRYLKALYWDLIAFSLAFRQMTS